jgi:chromosome segregation ATPase
MRRFWKNQAALDAGNPVALTRLPPEFADAAVELWEQALRLSLQTAKVDENGARQRLEELRQESNLKLRSLELREKEWDMAARVRERALADAREQVMVLVGELAVTRAELRSRERRNVDLATQVEQLREQLANLIAKAVARHRSKPRRVDGKARARSASNRSRRRQRPPVTSTSKRPSPKKPQGSYSSLGKLKRTLHR